MEIVISKPINTHKKFDATINGTNKNSFGDSLYGDFTKQNDSQRKTNYINHHKKEDWSKSNMASPAGMSRHILWKKTTLKGAVDNANKQNIKMLSLF